MTSKGYKLFLVYLLSVILTHPSSAYAYIDPGTGGLLYQMGFAFFSLFMGFIFIPGRFLKRLFQKIKRIFD